ncbi:MAG: peptidylprolyl isomerase [Acidobacteria bacterium]|nr:peptidylprolyl isomerase [Acidobacteriota bacterium]
MRLSYLWLVAALSLGSCARQQPAPSAAQQLGSVIATIGERPVHRAEFVRYLRQRFSDFSEEASQNPLEHQLLEEFLEEQLLLVDAERAGIQLTSEEKQSARAQAQEHPQSSDETVQVAEQQWRLQKYLRQVVLQDLSVSAAEIQEHFQRHENEFRAGEMVHVKEILLNSESQARSVMLLLKRANNGNFAELARLYSLAPTARLGGELGYFERGQLPEEFERVIFRLKPGQLSSVVRSKYGFHIFLVEERIRAHQQKFYEVEDVIRQRLLAEREKQLVGEKLNQLRLEFPILIKENRT